MRHIICKECGDKLGAVDPQDAAAGWKRRVVEIVAQKPDEHTVTVYAGADMENLKKEKTIHVPSIVCDRCGRNVADGEPAKAVTMWRGKEPELWESAYNKPILWQPKL